MARNSQRGQSQGELPVSRFLSATVLLLSEGLVHVQDRDFLCKWVSRFRKCVARLPAGQLAALRTVRSQTLYSVTSISGAP